MRLDRRLFLHFLLLLVRRHISTPPVIKPIAKEFPDGSRNETSIGFSSVVMVIDSSSLSSSSSLLLMVRWVLYSLSSSDLRVFIFKKRVLDLNFLCRFTRALFTKNQIHKDNTKGSLPDIESVRLKWAQSPS